MTRNTVALVAMPLTMTVHAGSLALPLLGAILKRDGIDADLLYLNLYYNRFFETVDRNIEIMSEHVFCDLCFNNSRSTSIYNNKLNEFFNLMLKSYPWEQYKLVGFSVNYYQLLPSMIMAKLLKKKYCDIKVIFGGSIFSQNHLTSELIRNESYLDYVIEGEADNIITDIVCNILNGNHIYGESIYSGNRNNSGSEIKRSPVNLNTSPFLDYSFLIDQFSNLIDPDLKSFSINMELSRGCRKAGADPCTFCNEMLRFGGMNKSIENTVKEITYYKEIYNISQINFCDALTHVGTILKILRNVERLGLKFTLYGNPPNIKRKTIEEFKRLGVIQFQVGIESLNDHILDLMNKKTNFLNCINVLKWCRHNSIQVDYNILTGIPGEKEDDYWSQSELFRLINFLLPPMQVNDIYNNRGSFFWEEQEKYKIKNYPDKLMSYFPEEYDKYLCSYFFSIDFPEKHKCQKAIDNLRTYVEYWKSNINSFFLYYVIIDDSVTVIDHRDEDEKIYKLTKSESDIFLLLDEPVRFSKIVELSDKQEEVVREILNKLIGLKIVLRNSNDIFLNLPLPRVSTH